MCTHMDSYAQMYTLLVPPLIVEGINVASTTQEALITIPVGVWFGFSHMSPY